MQDIFHILQVLIAVALIGLILIQHGKGADAGAAFGSGASATVFGSQGSASFLTRITAILATAFFLNSMVLAYMSNQAKGPDSVIQPIEMPIAPENAETKPAGNSDMPPLSIEQTTVPAPPAAESNNAPSAVPTDEAESTGDPEESSTGTSESLGEKTTPAN